MMCFSGMASPTQPHAQRGFSMIELMIAILIGSILLIGITTLFSTTSNVNRMENGLARLQENGRFALNRIAQDIRMASAMRNMRKASEGGGPGRTNPDRPLLSFVNLSTVIPGMPAPPAGSSRYLLSPVFMLRGYECISGCSPALNTANVGSDLYGGGIPATGINATARAAGADVLTLRYLQGLGTPLNEDQNLSQPGNQALSGTLAGRNIELAPGSNFQLGPSGLVVIGDYATSAIVAVTRIDGDTLQADNRNLAGAGLLGGFTAENDARVSDFDASMVTVSYYLRLSQDPSVAGRMISSLHRRQNGQDEAIAAGIERLDFMYHVEDRFGQIRPMTAVEVQAMTPATCPPASMNPELPPTIAAIDAANCGWRSVRAIEVSLLANTIDNSGSAEEPYQYSFLASGAPNPNGTVEVACDPTLGACSGGVQTLPSGLRPGRMLRREFRTVVALRNNAY
jgi:type IV pilus assembly protein PilW